jgi:phospholipid transport system substrate-binding protein
MGRTRRAATVVSMLILSVFLPAVAAAGSAADQLRARLDRVVGILEDPILKIRPEDRRSELRAAAIDIFDVTELARRSLGRHWHAATPAERDALVQWVTTRLESACLSRLDQYSGQRIAIVGESVDGELATVRTRLVGKDGVETPLDYRLHRAGDRWMAYDVSVEGVSLVASYRAQFNTIVQSSSTQALVLRLQEKRE